MLLLLPLFMGLVSLVTAEGINCEGSGACPVAVLENHANEGVMQGLRDALYSSNADPNTMYNSGDHVICISTSIAISISLKGLITLGGNIPAGGICLFPQHLKQPLSLASIRLLADALLKHGCTACGSVPVHFVDQGSNDPSSGILTFNFVSNPVCVGNCLGTPVGSGTNQVTNNAQTTPLVTVQQSIVTVQQPGTSVESDTTSLQQTGIVQTQTTSPMTTDAVGGSTVTTMSTTPATTPSTTTGTTAASTAAPTTVHTGMASKNACEVVAWIAAFIQTSLYLGL